MGLFDQKQISTGSNVTQSTASQTAAPWAKTVKPWGTLLGGVSAELKNPAANPWLDSVLGGTMGIANGGEMGIDPALQAQLDDNAARIGTQVGSMAFGAGRYGSRAAMGDMVDRITSANNPLYAQNFQMQLGRKDAARGMLGGLAQYMDQRPWDRFKNAGGILGIGGQMGGTKSTSGWTNEDKFGTTKIPSSGWQDAAGIGGLAGKFLF